MKRICITYRMERLEATKEDCIVIPAEEERANEILENQNKSFWVFCTASEISVIINSLTTLQGYKKGYFVRAEAVK